MNISETIKRIRQSKGLNQAFVAEHLNIALNNYSKIERGVTDLTISRLYEIAKILEVPINELLGEQSLPNNVEEIIKITNETVESKNLLIANLESVLSAKEETISLYKQLNSLHRRTFEKIIEVEFFSHFIYNADIYLKLKQKGNFNKIDCFEPNPRNTNLDTLPVTKYLIINNLVDIEKLELDNEVIKEFLKIVRQKILENR